MVACLGGERAPSVVADYAMQERDAEVVVAAACLLHCVGMSIHRRDHERYSLFLTADKLGSLLEGIYEEPERSIIVAETLHAIIGHRRLEEHIEVIARVDAEHEQRLLPVFRI